jgi:all-trans-retinol dehydrogenase (NAD+)
MSVIKGSNILITGGANGIGRLMALRLAKLGGNIILADINKENLDSVVKEIEENGGKVKGYVCDLSNREDTFAFIEKVNNDYDGVDILINNAGIVNGKGFVETSIDEIEKAFRINTLAHFWLIKGFIDGMVKRNRGHIVTISSAAGIIGVKKLSDYCSSKFAVFGLTESLRVEFKAAKLNIKTTIVSPFYILRA